MAILAVNLLWLTAPHDLQGINPPGANPDQVGHNCHHREKNQITSSKPTENRRGPRQNLLDEELVEARLVVRNYGSSFQHLLASEEKN
jgi:hypothetical protein